MWRFYRNQLAVIGVLGIYPLAVLIQMLIQMVLAGNFTIPESTNTVALMLLPFLFFFRYLRVPHDEMMQQNVYQGAFWGFILMATLLIIVGALAHTFAYDGFWVGCSIALPVGIFACCALPLFFDLKDSHYARSDNQ